MSLCGTLLNLILLSIISGCGFQFKAPSSLSGNLSGKVLPLQGFLASKEFSYFSAYAAPVCSDQVHARLFTLDHQGNLGAQIDEVEVNSSTTFNFPLSKLSDDVNVKYVIEITGCDQILYRPVTNLGPDQDVTYYSTIIGLLTKTNSIRKLNETTKEEVSNLLKELSGSSLQSAYQNLSTNLSLSNKFQQTFGNLPSVLEEAAPQVLSTQVPTILMENVSANFTVNATHFSPAYNIIYKWKLNGALKSSANTWTYTPGANDQGTKTLALYIGKDDGNGEIDTSVPYISRSYLLTVLNTILPVSPAISITSTTVNSRNITVNVATGTSLSNCRTFSTMALTDNITLPPLDSEFVYSCSTAGSQALNYSLNDTGDGIKIVRLWTKDSSGTISSTPSMLNVNLDQAAPTVSITASPASVTNQTSQSISFTSNDYGGAVAGYQCKLDGESWYTCSSPANVTGLTEGAHTFKITATDLGGNTSLEEVANWTVNLTAPVASFLTTPSVLTNSTTSSFTFSASASNGAIVSFYQCSLDGAAFTSCSSPFSAVRSQGNHSLQLKAVDSSGNTSVVTSFSWVIDTTAPTLTLTSTPASLTNLTSGSFSFSGSDTGGGTVSKFECSLDNSSFGTCSSPYSFSGLSVGLHNFKIRATDSVGNISSETSYSWTIDLTSSIASISSNPLSITNSTSASFSFSATPPPGGSVSSYECQLDGSSWNACSSPTSFSEFFWIVDQWT